MTVAELIAKLSTFAPTDIVMVLGAAQMEYGEYFSSFEPVTTVSNSDWIDEGTRPPYWDKGKPTYKVYIVGDSY